MRRSFGCISCPFGGHCHSGGNINDIACTVCRETIAEKCRFFDRIPKIKGWVGWSRRLRYIGNTCGMVESMDLPEKVTYGKGKNEVAG